MFRVAFLRHHKKARDKNLECCRCVFQQMKDHKTQLRAQFNEDAVKRKAEKKIKGLNEIRSDDLRDTCCATKVSHESIRSPQLR